MAEKVMLKSRKYYLVNPKTKEQYRVGGCRFSNKPSSAPKFSASSKYMNVELPAAVDLREYMTPIENQTDSSSCTANALAGAYEFLIKKNTGKHVDVSRLFIYYNARVKDGFKEYDMIDDGSNIAAAVEGLAEFGCCKEDIFPFIPRNLNQKPPEKCYSEAKHYRIQQGMQLKGELNELKACLAEGYPFVFGLVVFPSFNEAATNGGRVPMPNLDDDEEIKNENVGGHAMLAVGYSDRSECFIVRNSWGEEWGDKGYCYIPYQYMCGDGLCADIHSIKTITEPPANERRPWIKEDTEDYYHSIWPDTSTEKSSSKSDSMLSHILWMDDEKEQNLVMTKHLSNDPRVKMITQPVFALAVDYLSQNKDRIKSFPKSTIFQIVCRGFYKSEYKNALDLLPFLKHYQLEDIPILVITADKEGVTTHFDRQAELMGIVDWKSRIYVTDQTTELITQINGNLIEKAANRSY